MVTLYEASAASKSKPVTERVKTFEDACRELGIDKVQLGVIGIDANDSASLVAYTKLIIIAKALNEGWQPDWSDNSQYKYVPWFKDKPGFGLSCFDYAYWFTFSGVGSRLCYKSKELAMYAATQFADLYNDFLSIK